MTEYDKKQLLVLLADSKVGDFYLTVSKLVNGYYFSNATFNQIVAVLDNINVTKDSSSVQSITRDLRNTRLFETASIGTQLVETLGKISKVTNHLIGDGGMSFETQFPVALPNETQDEFDARIVNYLKQVISDMLIIAVVGLQLSDDVHKKKFLEIFKLLKVF